MKNLSAFAILLLIGGYSSANLASAGEVYKWVDDQGKVHYGDASSAPLNPNKDPDKNVDVEKLKIRDKHSAPNFSADQENQTSESQSVNAQKQRYASNCAIAQENIAALNDEKKDVTKDGRVLTAEERASYLEDAKEDVRRYCEGQSSGQ